MAGIGFELKRLFAKKGILATLRAYGYAGMICAGPMLLGFALLLGVIFLANYFGAARHDRELLVSMITYALLASLTVTSIFSMLTTRYTSDMLYEERNERVMPSFYGSISIMLVAGGLLYGVFLIFSGVALIYQVLSFIYFMTLIITWTEVNYLTAIKDYRSIMLAFTVALAATFVIGFLLIKLTPLPIIASLFIAVVIGYGIMAVWYFILLYRYFPEGFGTSMGFLKWFSKYPYLAGIGFFTTLGLFGHLVLMWFSDIGEQIEGLFYGAPEHDVAALMAFFSILITTINFVTSVEVRFYPKYRNYFSLFNEGGSVGDIETAEKSMIDVLRDEISYLAQKQAFTTILFIVVGTLVLPRLPLGFNDDMLGMFRVLCVGYALYAIGNSVMLILLYFADNKGAFFTTLLFAAGTNIMTLVIMLFSETFYGFGFVIGGAIYCIVVFFRLEKYISKLKYHVLAEQPVFEPETSGYFAALADDLDRSAYKKQRKRRKYYNKRMEERNDK